METPKSKMYPTRKAAIAAARQACRKALGPAFQPALFHDYDVVADYSPEYSAGHYGSPYSGPSYYVLRGPVAEAVLAK
jgi:hypothetical protein